MFLHVYSLHIKYYIQYRITSTTLMTQQWLRKVSLILGDEDGEALNMSELRVAFSVQGGVVLTPKHADILIFNVAPHTAQRIQKEFRCVELQAGYADNAGLIFSGTAIQIRRARLGATHTDLHIVATDGDAAHNFSVVHATLAAGWAAADAHQTLTQSAALYGVTAGYAPEFPATRMPRAKTMFGMSRDYLDALAASMDATCHVEDGQLQVVPNHGYLPGEAVGLNAQTGLIGRPEQPSRSICPAFNTLDTIQAGQPCTRNCRALLKTACTKSYMSSIAGIRAARTGRPNSSVPISTGNATDGTWHARGIEELAEVSAHSPVLYREPVSAEKVSCSVPIFKKQRPCTAPTVRAFCFNPLIAPRSKTSVKYSKGKFKMTREGMVLEARLCPWLRFCIGAAMLFLAATPLIYVARWW